MLPLSQILVATTFFSSSLAFSTNPVGLRANRFANGSRLAAVLVEEKIGAALFEPSQHEGLPYANDSMDAPLETSHASIPVALSQKTTTTAQDPTDLSRDTMKKNKAFRNANKMRKVSARNPTSLAHASIGMLSLALGAAHGFGAVTDGFGSGIGQTEFLVVGLLQIVTGALGVARLEWTDKQVPRNALIWPNPLLNTWYLTAALSQWGLGENAVFDMYGAPMEAYTAAFLGLLAYQTAMTFRSAGQTEIERQNSGVSFQKQSDNLLGGALVYFAPFALPGLCDAAARWCGCLEWLHCLPPRLLQPRVEWCSLQHGPEQLLPFSPCL